MVYRWLSRGWFALGILFVLLAMMVTLVRVGGPLLNQYRESLIHTLLGDSQLKVSVGQVGLDWTQSGPALELQQLAIAPDSGRFTVQLGKAWVHLDFWRTLNQLKPVFGELILSDGDITLDFSQPANSREPEGDAQQGALLRFLLTQLTTFDVHNTRLSVTTSVGDLRALDIAQLRWQNRGKRHQGVGKAYLINGVGESTIDLILEVEAPSARLDRLKGQLYLGARQLDISPILAKIHAGEPKLAGQIDFQLWSEFDHGKLGNTLLEFGNNYLIWKDLKDQRLHRLGLDGGKIQLRRDGQNWQLASHNVIFKLDDKPWLHSRLQLERVGERVQGYVPQIDLDQIAQLSQLVSGIYPAQSELLKQSKPKGKLTDLTLQADAGWQDLSLSGQIAHVSLNAWHDVPGFGDLNGEFWLTPKGGRVSVALLSDKLDPARHFKEPIPVDRLSARLDWWREAQGWVLYGQDIALDNPDLTLASRFRLDLFEHPFLALTGRIDVKNAGNADRYYPLQVMDKGLVDYLSGALKGGKAKGADLLWYGEFRDFPYEQGEGIFQVAVPLEQATYQFFPGWQSLTDLQIDLLFQNASLDMRSRSTMLGKASSDSVHAWIPSLSPGGHLYVDAKVQGEGQAISDYLQDSPLGSSVGQALREIEIRGPMAGSVKLDIPLDGESEVKASGDAIFSNNKVRVASLDLPLEKVQGRLEYDNEQTRFSNLKASLWNQPLTLDYQGRQHPDHYQVDLNFKGQWDSRRQPAAISSFGILNGRSNWGGKLGLTLPESKPFSFQLAMDSNLQGMGLDLPLPLAKVASSRLPLKVIARGRDGSADIRAVLGADVDMQTRLVYGEGVPYLSRLRVDVGQPGARVLRDVPMLLAINQQEADVGGWLARLKQWLPAQNQTGNAVVGPSFLPQEWWVDGQLARAYIGSATLKATRFTVGPTNQATEVMIDSPDVMGVIRLPAVANRPVDAKFARIHWSGKSSDLSPDPDAKQDNAIMASIPWLQVSCVDCRFGELPLGEVKGELVPGANKVTLKGLDVRLAGSQLTGSVDWLADGNRMQTRARGKLTSNNSELLLKRLGYTSPIGDAPGSLAFDLNWQDVPYRPSLPTLGGSANYQLEGGTLREVNDKGARLLSLLSLDSLLRKLRLDFRDVFDKGFYFESMSASATIKQGQVSNDDFYMKGAAGNLRGEGIADLVRWQLDYELSFSPNLGGTLPVVAAFSITPVTGLYVLALSKLLEPVVDVVTRIDFRISGPLDAPKLIEAGRDRARIKLNQQQKQAVDAAAPTLPAATPFLLNPQPGSPRQP
ncbi:TIGR02099 family protein [Aeromonas sobria]|uniref:TIGR02099 family protein n=1 Tax=Aeromonas sobria TaxID=646 RepID=A0A1S2D3I4_AERSO|nr:YhdP family protein [Aeromonas sobria]MBS4687866.1 TIGR02099 family protein [Aeromonas sobria]OHY94788.1 TIGR02099 family protein [Aeromonas sobria]